MKGISAVLLSVIIGVGFASCQKDHSNSDAANFVATIDSNQFAANQFSAAIALNTIAIAGKSDDGRQIVLRVKDSGVHVYSLDINSFTNAGAYSINDDNAYTTNGGNNADESGGTLSILSIDTSNKKISGTFSMKVYRQIDAKQIIITKGSFTNIPYVSEAFPASKAGDTMTVKVDGTPFAGYSITGTALYGQVNVSVSNKAVTEVVGLSLPSGVTAGTYTFSTFGDYIAQYNTSSAYLLGDSGSVTILEHNTTTKRIRGNFSFHAKEMLGTKTAQLTEGYFSVVYK
jgi:hypothetical protein